MVKLLAFAGIHSQCVTACRMTARQARLPSLKVAASVQEGSCQMSLLHVLALQRPV